METNTKAGTGKLQPSPVPDPKQSMAPNCIGPFKRTVRDELVGQRRPSGSVITEAGADTLAQIHRRVILREYIRGGTPYRALMQIERLEGLKRPADAEKAGT